MTRIHPRAECRSCGRDSALTQENLIHGHLSGDSRCRGGGRPPAGEPPCDVVCGRMVGRVSYPPDLTSADLSKPHASTYVCADTDHQAEAAEWVRSKTGRAGVFVGREVSRVR